VILARDHVLCKNWYLYEVLFKISDELARAFYMGVPPGGSDMQKTLTFVIAVGLSFGLGVLWTAAIISTRNHAFLKVYLHVNYLYTEELVDTRLQSVFN